MSDSPFKILAFDGGGIRGLFAASFVRHIEEHTGTRLADHFDLITGTSTGAIIALGLASGLSGDEILRFYREHGPRIFTRGRGWIAQIGRPKYENDQLVAALHDVLGDRTLDSLDVPVCVPSYELVAGIPRVLKSNHNSELHWGGDQLAWKVAAASSAAPLYFPPAMLGEEDRHIDGGVWANNPAMVGITEAMRYFGRPLEEIAMLSIGTGSKSVRMRPGHGQTWGIADWMRRRWLVDIVFGAQSQSAHYAAELLLGPDRYLRVDVDLAEGVPLDDYHAAQPLIQHGVTAGLTHKSRVEAMFLNGIVP